MNTDLNYEHLVRQVRYAVCSTVPLDSTVLIVSKGDNDLLDIEGRRAWHFPQTEDGSYVGYHVADSIAAIAHLEVLRAKGAQFLVFPSTAFWWLDHYKEFWQHLEARYDAILCQENVCVVYALFERKDAPMYKLRTEFDREIQNVSIDVSPNDVMYWSDPNHYFRIGLEALQYIKLALLAAGKEDPKRILDLPCGHGRVLRTVKAAFPEARLTACDIDKDAVDYCVRSFGAYPVYAETHPNQIDIEGEYDLIWCGSLLTHLDRDRWEEFVEFFHTLLAPGGILIFTLLGRRAAEVVRTNVNSLGLTQENRRRILEDFNGEGFGYQDWASREGYGISLSSPSWTCSQLEKRSELRLLSYTEGDWAHFQDVIACVRA